MVRIVLRLIATLIVVSSAIAEAPVIEQFTPEASSIHLEWGASITLTATASGEKLTYEWYHNDRLVADSYGPTLSIDDVTASDGGRYWVIVRNAEGAARGPTTYVAIDWLDQPHIDRATPGFTLTEGEPFTLEVVWRGTLPATIKWTKDGEVIQTGSSNQFTVASATPADGGIYTAWITNAAGYDVRTITVAPIPASARLPRFLAPLTDFATETGVSNRSLTIRIDGEFPIQCELLHDGRVISTSTANQTNAYLDFPVIDVSLFGDYTVRLTNAVGTVSSEVFRMSRQAPSPPAFASYNQWLPELTVLTGSSIYLSPEIIGSEPKTFQWFKDQQAMPQATSSVLSIPNSSAEDQGSYTLRVSNPAGVFITPPVEVLVTETHNQAPKGAHSFTVSEHAPGESVYLSRFLNGSLPMTYQWTHNGVVIPGATGSSYSFEIATEADYGDYHLIASNEFGTARVHVRTLVPRSPFPPIITYDLFSTYAYTVEDQNQILRVSATGGDPLTFQWYRDGEAIPGATSGGILLGQTDTPPDHDYHVEITNPFGRAVSSTCRVASTTPVLPIISSHPQHLHLFPGGSTHLRVAGNNVQRVTIAWFKNGELLPDQPDSLLHVSGEASAGDYHATLTNSVGTVTSEVAHVTYGEEPPTPFVRIPGSFLTSYNGLYPSSLHDPGIQFETLHTPLAIKWFRDGAELPGQTSNRLKDDLLDDNIYGTYVARVTTSAGDFDTPPIHVNAIAPGSVPRLPSNERKIARAIGSSVYFSGGATSPLPMTFEWHHNGELMPFANSDEMDIPGITEADLGQYTLQATNAFGTSETATFTLSSFPLTAPTVVTPETNIEMPNPASSSETRRISVYVAGQNLPNFQWFKDGQPLAGQTRSFVTLRGNVTEAAGEYQARVSNSVGTAWSEVITVTVVDNPVPFVPEMQAARHLVSLGESLTLTAPTSSHPGPLTYQWLLNGNEVGDAITSSLEISGLSVAATGTYSVRISDGSHILTRDVAMVESTNAFSPLRGRHRIVGNGVDVGQPVRIHTRLTPLATVTDATYALLVPEGWSLAAQTATGTSVAPTVGDTDLLEWSWAELPAGTLDFEFTLTPPSATTGTEELAALLESTRDFLSFQALAMPDPIVLAPVPSHHTADTNVDGQIDLSELLRVIELYNTRNGTTRTGRYQTNATTADGLHSDPTALPDSEPVLDFFHLADTDWDGSLSLNELLRVIELYNTRTGTTRTGAYHRANGTDDGFAPGGAD